MNKTNTCPDVSKLEYLNSLQEDDPQRKHINQCTRCAALWKSCEAFLNGSELPAEAREAEANLKLTDFIQQEIVQSPGRSKAAGNSSDRRISGSRWPFRSVSNPAAWVGIAAVLVAVVGLGSFWAQDGSLPHEARQRGEQTYPTNVYPAGTVEVSDSGEVSLSWSEMSGATTYQVVLLDIDLVEFRRLDPVTETEITLAPEVFADQRDPVYWTVVGLAGQRKLARTRTSILGEE